MKGKTIIPPSNRHLRRAIKDTIEKIEQVDRQRIAFRDILTHEEREELRLKVLDLQDKYLNLTKSLEEQEANAEI